MQATGSSAAAAAANPAAGPSSTKPAPLSAVLGGKPLNPIMLHEIVSKFNPRRASALSSAPAANGKLSMAQMMSAKNAASGSSSSLEQEQEDAQEFLQFLVDVAHEELVQLSKQLGPGSSLAADNTGQWAVQVFWMMASMLQLPLSGY